MVSKVAVIAIVGILAVPILLGYAMNVEQVTETDYRTTGDPMNVTQFLQNGVGYNYANGNAYELNTNFSFAGYNPDRILPAYKTISSVKSSLPLEQYHLNNFSGGTEPLTDDSKYCIYLNYYDLSTSNFKAEIYHNTTLLTTINGVNYVYYDHSSDRITYSYFTSGSNTNTQSITGGEYTSVTFTKISGSNVSIDYSKQRIDNSTAGYADLSGGFIFKGLPNKHDIVLPSSTNTVLLTIDLGSITDANYSFGIHFPGGQHTVEKTTVGGVVHWKTRNDLSPHNEEELYYDPSISNNTYQVLLQVLDKGSDNDNTYAASHIEYRYIGNWTKTIGKANYYQVYSWDNEYSLPIPNYPIEFNYITIQNVTGNTEFKTPVLRVDDAVFKAMEYPVIENRTYNPANFKINPSTTISDPVLYGTSISFGGNTYSVKNGNITMGTHEIPVKGLVLSSVPNPNGGYDNKIGNTVISTTSTPSSINFMGKWSASISTSTQEEYEFTKTEWKAGSFAWDGMDQNFLMVGLLASLGAFIALGIYARRSRASVWPLLIVCGGAALLFFVML